MTRPVCRTIAAVCLAVVLAAACGADDPDEGSGPQPTDSATPGDPLPPSEFDELVAIYDPLVEPWGVKVTRAALIDRSEGYLESPTGTHLALYVEPVDEESYTTEAYITGMYELTELTADHAFSAWSDLESYDICQEPWPSEDDSLTPFPITQIDMTREAVDSFDWEAGTLPGLLDHLDSDDESRWVVAPSLTRTDEFQAIAEQKTVDSEPRWG